MRLFCVLLVACCLGFPCIVTAGFDVLDSFEESPEGGKMENFVISTETHQFTLVPPANYHLDVDKQKKEIYFSSTNDVGIWIRVTTNFPGGLPREDALKRNVLRRYPDAAVLRSAACNTRGPAGWLVDVKRVFSRDLSVTTRHVFVPWAEGTVEFTFSSRSEEFEERRNLFGGVLNSFRAAPFRTPAR